jgi:hypothetical protein
LPYGIFDKVNSIAVLYRTLLKKIARMEPDLITHLFKIIDPGDIYHLPAKESPITLVIRYQLIILESCHIP